VSSLLDILHRKDSSPDCDPVAASTTGAPDDATDNLTAQETLELRLAVDNGPPGNGGESPPRTAAANPGSTTTYQRAAAFDALFGAAGTAAADGLAASAEPASSLGIPGAGTGQLTAEKIRQRSRRNTVWLAASLTLIILAAGAATWLLNEVAVDSADDGSLFITPAADPISPPLLPERAIDRPAPVANRDTPRDDTPPATVSPPAAEIAGAAANSPETDWFDIPALDGLPDTGDSPMAEPIRIVRGTTTNPLFPKLTEAWTAFQLADYARAESLYREVLAADATSVDALLGLGAIAARGNRADEARSLYESALLIDPRNATANSALSTLPANGTRNLDESALKTLLRDQPGAASLHFALGLRYVAQGRWPDAQDAFFEAVKNEPTNADYAYNLAVSLDRLRQTGPAAAYYQRALDLATAGALFNPTVAQERLTMLRAAPD